MIKSALTAVVALTAGYLVGALLGYVGIAALSSNSHDRAVEAAMTAAFVTGPIGALLAATAWMLLRRKA